MRVTRIAHGVGTTAVGLIAGTALAHVFELPHKFAMSAETWLPIQSVLYNGWGGKLFYLDVLAILGLLFTAFRSPSTRAPALAAVALLLAADVVVFLIWINPTNTAVDLWAMSTPMRNWRELRLNWEWGHAARSGLLVLATLLATLAAPRERNGTDAS